MRTARQQRERVQQVRNSAGLTVTKATRDARRIVNGSPMMPGPFATVESRMSWDMNTDRQVIITTITFPPSEDGARLLAANLWGLRGALRVVVADSSIVITRKVK